MGNHHFEVDLGPIRVFIFLPTSSLIPDSGRKINVCTSTIQALFDLTYTTFTIFPSLEAFEVYCDTRDGESRVWHDVNNVDTDTEYGY